MKLKLVTGFGLLLNQQCDKVHLYANLRRYRSLQVLLYVYIRLYPFVDVCAILNSLSPLFEVVPKVHQFTIVIASKHICSMKLLEKHLFCHKMQEAMLSSLNCCFGFLTVILRKYFFYKISRFQQCQTNQNTSGTEEKHNKEYRL